MSKICCLILNPFYFRENLVKQHLYHPYPPDEVCSSWICLAMLPQAFFLLPPPGLWPADRLPAIPLKQASLHSWLPKHGPQARTLAVAKNRLRQHGMELIVAAHSLKVQTFVS